MIVDLGLCGVAGAGAACSWETGPNRPNRPNRPSRPEQAEQAEQARAGGKQGRTGVYYGSQTGEPNWMRSLHLPCFLGWESMVNLDMPSSNIIKHSKHNEFWVALSLKLQTFRIYNLEPRILEFRS